MMGWEWPWERWRRMEREARASERQAFLDALQAVVAIAQAHAAAGEALAAAIDGWAKPWREQASTPSRNWTNNDMTEWLKEHPEITSAPDFPSHLPPAQQYLWLAQQMDFDPLRQIL